MKELIEKLTKEVNLTPEQAAKAIETIASFVKEKFPMLGGAVDSIFGTEGE
jgi:nucleoid DNA-binding protein